MQGEIICIGTELILGKTVNTNACYLSQRLAHLGIDLFYHTTVGDNKSRLFTVLKRAMHRSDIVITTGGLGPTVDDITLEVIAQVMKKRLILNSAILKDLKSRFQNRHLSMPKANNRQALIPEGAKPIKNELGTAPGLIIPYNDGKKVLIALPGVPVEMKLMMEQKVISYLARNFAATQKIVSKIIKTTGLAESQVNQKVKDILKLKPPLTVGIYAHIDSVDLNITAKAKTASQAEKLINHIERKIYKRLKEYIYGENRQTLEEIVAEALHKTRKTIAVAESCTGGLISKRLTNIRGSSRYFPLGIVAYSNQIKQSLLAIPKETLKKFGAVSKQIACLMAKNIRQLAKVDLGLGITGIAGPTGGTKEKPVGLVYICLATSTKLICKKFYFLGERQAVRRRASQAALDLARRYLLYNI
jgi:nicotinamide-nucleotide amidase